MADNIYPINAFPKTIQDIINHYSEVKGYPCEYFMTALLATVSTANGRAVTLNTGNYTAIGILWVAIIGKPGLIKSEAQTDAFKPIKEKQFEYIKQYNTDITELEYRKQSNPKDKTIIPHPPKFLLSDITPEALSMVLSENPKGCGIVYDELAGFVGRFNRYNSGADEQMFLSLFNGDTILRTRVDGKNNAAIKNSFTTISGTIQPSVMRRVFADKSESGFFDRWLMCFPENVKKEYPKPYGVDPIIEGKYHYIINRILSLQYDEYNQQQMNYSFDSKKLVYDYQCTLIDLQNTTENDSERSILAKMEIYLHRFALLLQVIEYADISDFLDPSKLTIVSINAAQGAILLTQYFIEQANKIRVLNPLEAITDEWRELYTQLPGHGITFTRVEFIKKCADFGIKSRKADEFLKNNAERSEIKLLYKVKQGIYTKNLF